MQEQAQSSSHPKDCHLDVPQEARQDNHINFSDLENSGDGGYSVVKDQETTERQRAWKQGIEEGKQERDSKN